MTNSGAIVADGYYNVEFKLYNNASSSGSSQGSCTGDASCLWSETRTTANTVRVKNGYLAVNLGSVTAFGGIDFSQQLWMTMRIGGTAVSPAWDAEMSPRLQLTAVPYALKAADSATLGGIASGGFIQNTTTPQAASNFNITGNGTIGGNLSVSGNANLIKTTTNATTAFQIQNAGATPVVSVDTVNQRLSLQSLNASSSALSILYADGTPALEFRAGGTASGSFNSLIGVNAGGNNTTGSSLTAFGNSALRENTSGFSNTAVGESALRSNTTGHDNIAFGTSALRNNTSGASNAAIGNNALNSNTSGDNNLAFGSNALLSNTTGYSNTAIGAGALAFNIGGAGNSAFGAAALQNNNGNNNVAFGGGTLVSNSSGGNNTAIGLNALYYNASGFNNSAVGTSAGFSDGDTFATLSTLSNATILGANAQSLVSNSVILGGAGTNAVNVGIGTPSPTNVLSVSPVQYGAGGPAGNGTTASQSGTTVTGVSTTFTTAMVGSEIVFKNGSKATITAFLSATSLTVTPSQTVTSQLYRIQYAGLQVHNGGNVGVGTTTPGYRLDVQAGDINTSGVYRINGSSALSSSALNFGAASAATIQSAAGQALNITGNAASTIATTAGALTLQAGGTTAVIVKSASNSATAFQVQNSLGIAILNVSTASQTISMRSSDATTAVFNLQHSDGSVALEMRTGGIGLNNSFIGLNSGMTNTTGSNNTAFGINSLQLNTAGFANTGIGALALIDNTTGTYNTAIGGGALGSNTTGNYNVAIGTDAGRIDNDGFTTPGNLNNSMAIGFQSQVQANNTLVLGGAGNQQIKVGIGTSITRNVLSVEPLQYNTGMAAQSGTTVTGIGTSFTAAMYGSHITFAGGQDATIISINSATSLTVDVSQTVSNQNYRIHYSGLQVGSNGRVGIGTPAPGYQLDVLGDINTSSTYRAAGVAGSNTSCTGGQLLQNAVVAGGIITGGSCVAPGGGGGGATSVAFSTTQNANGGSISGGILTLAEAGTTNPGLVSGNAQTFAGLKTFTSSINTSTGNAYQINAQNILSATALNFTAASAGTINAAASQALNLTGNAASTFSTTAGSLTLNGSASVSITTGGNITLGTANTTGTLLVLDDKTSSTDPTGVNGGMYYNSSRSKFRCYEKNTWKDCLSPWTVITKATDQDVTNSSALINDNDLQFSVVANTTYIMNFYIVTSGNSSSADYEFQFTFPINDTTSNVSGRMITTGIGNGISSSSGQLGTTTGWPASSTTTGTAASYTSKRVLEGFVSFQPTTSGTMNFTFAQATAGGAGTSARTNAGSFIEYVAIP